jgi:dienelactone hydrolase
VTAVHAIEWLEERRDAECVQREFTVMRDGRSIPGVLWTPVRPSAGKPLVLFGHGASGDRHQTPIPYVARRVVSDAGFFALAIDGPVRGRRKVGDGGRGAFAVEWRRDGSVADMLGDWRCVLDNVQRLSEVGEGSVGYWGLSMGSIFGVPLIAAEPRIVVAVLGLLGVAGPTDAHRQQLRAAAAAVTCPLLFLMQLEDELFSRDQYLALFDGLASSDKRLHANPGLHPDVPMEELDFSAEFLRRYLDGAGKARRQLSFTVSQ